MSRQPREPPLWGSGRRDKGLLARVSGALSSALVTPFTSASGRWKRLRGASLAASIPPASVSPSISRTLVRALEEEEQMDEVTLYPISIDSGDFERERVLGSRDVDVIFSTQLSSSSTNVQQTNLVTEAETPGTSVPRCSRLTGALHTVANFLKRILHAEQRCLFIHVCARRSRLAIAGLLSMFWGLVVCGLSFYIISLVVNGNLDDMIQEAVILGDWRYAIVPTVAAASLLLHGAYVVFGALLIGASKNSDLRSERKRDRIPELLFGSFVGLSENDVKIESSSFPQSAFLPEEKKIEEEHKSQKKSLVLSRESQMQIGECESSDQHQYPSLERESYNIDDAPSSSYVLISINNTSDSHPHEMRTHLPICHNPSRPTTNMTRSFRAAIHRSISADESVVRSVNKVDSSSVPEHVNSSSAEHSASTSTSGRASFVSCTNTEISSSEWNTPRSQSYFEGFFFDCLSDSESSLTDKKGAIIAVKRPSVIERITEFLKRLSKRNNEQLPNEKKSEGVFSGKEKQVTNEGRPSFASHWLKPWLITASMNLKIYSLLSIGLTFMGYYTIPALIIPLNVSLLVCIVDVFAELRGVSETSTLREQHPPDAGKNNEVESTLGFTQDPSTSQSQIPPIYETLPLL